MRPVLGAFLVFTLSFPTLGQKATWEKVTHTMEVDETSTERQIKEQLLKYARQKAIENVSGVNVESFTLSNEAWSQDSENNEFFQSFRVMSNVSSQGMIIEEKKPKYTERDDWIDIEYQGKVAIPKDQSDPSFKVQCDLNQRIFQVGQELKLNVKATKDSYMTIFSITEDEQAALMFPNAYMTNQKLQAHVIRKVPNVEEAKNIALTMQPSPDGRKKYSEVLLCVVTKEPISYQNVANELNYNANWMTINRWIMDIPGDQRTLAYLQYQVLDK